MRDSFATQSLISSRQVQSKTNALECQFRSKTANKIALHPHADIPFFRLFAPIGPHLTSARLSLRTASCMAERPCLHLCTLVQTQAPQRHSCAMLLRGVTRVHFLSSTLTPLNGIQNCAHSTSSTSTSCTVCLANTLECQFC